MASQNVLEIENHAHCKAFRSSVSFYLQRLVVLDEHVAVCFERRHTVRRLELALVRRKLQLTLRIEHLERVVQSRNGPHTTEIAYSSSLLPQQQKHLAAQW